MTEESRLQRWLNGQRRSHQRTFQSREMVWQTYESLAREQGASIDQLIGEAMEAYAQQRGYEVPEEPAASEPAWAPPRIEERDPLEETRDARELSDLDLSYMPGTPVAAPRRAPSFDASAGWDDDSDLARTETRQAVERRNPNAFNDIKEPGDDSRTTPRYPRGGGGGSAHSSTGISPGTHPVPAAINRPVPTPAAGSLAPRRPIQPPLQPPSAGRPPPAPPPQPQPRQSSEPGRPSSSAAMRDTGSNPGIAKRLFLFHQGRQVEVDKERFLLGRSKTQADLRLDDPNVSRQHAAIERVGSAWYIVDLGSTNGIYVSGQRVTRRALAEGDLIVITSHEIRCSLR